MSTMRDKRPGPAGYIAYSVIGDDGAISYTPRGTVAVHFAVPTGSATTRTPCHLLPEEVCWPSTLPGLGARTYKTLQGEGEDALYRELESTYRAVFGDGGSQ